MITYSKFKARNDKGIQNLLQSDKHTTYKKATNVFLYSNSKDDFKEYNKPSTFTPHLKNSNCFVLSIAQSINTKFIKHLNNQY